MKKSKFTKLFVTLLLSTILLSCSAPPRRFEEAGQYKMTIDSISVTSSHWGRDSLSLTGVIADSLVTFTDSKNDTTFNRSEFIQMICLDNTSVYLIIWGCVYSLPYDENTSTYHITEETKYLNEFSDIQRCHTDISVTPLPSNQYKIRLYKLYDGRDIEILATVHYDIEHFKPLKRDEVLQHIEITKSLNDIEKGYYKIVLVDGHPELKHFFKQWTKFLVLP